MYKRVHFFKHKQTRFRVIAMKPFVSQVLTKGPGFIRPGIQMHISDPHTLSIQAFWDYRVKGSFRTKHCLKVLFTVTK